MPLDPLAAWLTLTTGRTDREVEHILGVVEAATRAMDAAVVAELRRLECVTSTVDGRMSSWDRNRRLAG
jgi:hypothetical protein